MTLSDYFYHLIPRRAIGNEMGTTPVHLLKDGLVETVQCSEPHCSHLAPVSCISTRWPITLSTISDAFKDVEVYDERVLFENSFEIYDKADKRQVTYELVGRIFGNGNHFHAQLRFDGWTYSYDDMQNGGCLVPNDDPYLLEKFDRNTLFYVYHRTSHKAMVCGSLFL